MQQSSRRDFVTAKERVIINKGISTKMILQRLSGLIGKNDIETPLSKAKVDFINNYKSEG